MSEYFMLNGRKFIEEIQTTPPPGYVYIRIPHDPERVNVDDTTGGGLRYRGNLPEYKNDPRGGRTRYVVLKNKTPEPEVYRLDPGHSTLLNCSAQRMWRWLNPELNDKRWSSLGAGGLGWCNGTGFTDGRYNCITGENINGKFLAFDQPRACGGAVFLAKIVGSMVEFLSMLTSDPILPASTVLGRKEFWYYGVSINPRGEINYITRPSGEDSNGANVKVRIPFLTAKKVYLPKDEVHILPSGFIPPSSLWMS